VIRQFSRPWPLGDRDQASDNPDIPRRTGGHSVVRRLDSVAASPQDIAATEPQRWPPAPAAASPADV